MSDTTPALCFSFLHFCSFSIITLMGYWLPPGPQKLLGSQGRACFSLLWVSCAWQVQNRKTFLLFSRHCCWPTSEGMKFGQWCLWTELWASFSEPVVVRKWHSWEAFPSNLKWSHSFCLRRDTARVSELTATWPSLTCWLFVFWHFSTYIADLYLSGRWS